MTRRPRALKNFARSSTQRLLLLPDQKHHEQISCLCSLALLPAGLEVRTKSKWPKWRKASELYRMGSLAEAATGVSVRTLRPGACRTLDKNDGGFCNHFTVWQLRIFGGLTEKFAETLISNRSNGPRVAACSALLRGYFCGIFFFRR